MQALLSKSSSGVATISYQKYVITSRYLKSISIVIPAYNEEQRLLHSRPDCQYLDQAHFAFAESSL